MPREQEAAVSLSQTDGVFSHSGEPLPSQVRACVHTCMHTHTQMNMLVVYATVCFQGVDSQFGKESDVKGEKIFRKAREVGGCLSS